MRIVRVTRAYPPIWDGAANHVVGLSRQQARAGHRVWVFQAHMPDSTDESRMLTRRRVHLPGTLQRGIYRNKAAIAAFHVRAAALESRLRREHGLDIIHAHGDALDAFLQAGVAWRSAVPLVQTVHGGLNRRWLYRHSAPYLFQGVTRFIAVSQSVAADLVDLGIPESRIAVISSGIDVRRFDGLPRAQNAHVLSIGRLHPVKGYPDLLEAVRLLAASGLKPRVTIVGVGAQRAALGELSQNLPNVHFAGAVPHEQIPNLLSTASVFVLPSVDLDGQIEGAPTVLMEAMAAGLPIITTNAGGVAELVRDGVNGLIVPQRSPASLAVALNELLHDEPRRRRMAEANREKAAAKDWSVIERQVAAEYENALRHRPNVYPDSSLRETR
jgi:glycosyltransferase involved in cell wall biosynthesis